MRDIPGRSRPDFPLVALSDEPVGNVLTRAEPRAGTVRVLIERMDSRH